MAGCSGMQVVGNQDSVNGNCSIVGRPPWCRPSAQGPHGRSRVPNEEKA